MMEMTDIWLDKDQVWVIGLYSKNGRSYSEIGVFYEGELPPVEAYEIFSQICSAEPTWQAVEHALNSEITGEYEVRLWSETQKRCLSTFIWDLQTMQEAINNIPDRKSHILTIEVDLFEDEQEEDPEFWDWEELVATQRLRVLAIEESSAIMVESASEGEDNENMDLP
jgi:hypothetical protein